MRRSNAPTLQDVARQSGVTAMTVSVVLNGARSATRVSEATRVRITAAAAELHYRPNGVARGLSRRRMDTIGIVAIVDGPERNLFFLEILTSILEAAARRGQNTTVFSVQNWEADEARILQFCDGRVDGMIFVAPARLTSAFAESLQHHTPFVTMHSNNMLPHTYNLDIDNEGGAYAIVRYLIEQGHRRIAHFPGQMEFLGAAQRIAGYRRALADAHIPLDESLVFPGAYGASSGRERASQLLVGVSATKQLPTALFCANDDIAAGSMEVFARHGVRVPEDISVAGFDDILTARMTAPALTTVRQPFLGMGARAVDMLLTQIQDGILFTPEGLVGAEGADTVSPSSSFREEDGGAPAHGPHTEVFPVELRVRGSVAPPPVALSVLPG